MKVTRFIAVTVIASSVWVGALHAKSLRDGVTPAEFPPASFKGGQYVDSKGCIYIRAGIDGNVTWVPRVSRKRQQVCGYKPSLTAAQIANAPITKPAGAAPVQITLGPSASAPSKPAQVAAPTKPRKPSTAPAPVAAAAPTPRPVAVAAAPAKPATRTPRRAPEPLVFVNPPPERVAAASAPVAPTSNRSTNRSAPRPAPVPLVFVNPPPEQVTAATAPVATSTRTTRPTRASAPRPEPQPLVFVNSPAVQTTSVASPQATAATGSATCRDASAFSQQYINSDARFPVRCGPQTQSAVTEFVSSGTVRTPTSAPAPNAPAAAPVQSAPVSPVQPPRAVAAQSNGTCPGASAFSQQYINSNARYPVRCGPQAASPVTEYGRRGTGQSVVADSTTRIVPRHVYENRQNAANVQVAEGYQNVWKDDRLNPRRAERTSARAVYHLQSQTPSGYKPAWDDDRLNTARTNIAPTSETAAGDAQTNQIWTQTLPRRLIVPPVSESKQIVVLSSRNKRQSVSRTSTRSAPQATAQAAPQIAGKPKYVRVATYESDASARTVAQNLARGGLPMRLGTLTRKGKAYRVVLAGPFTSTDQANAALAKVRGAGFSNAKISK